MSSTSAIKQKTKKQAGKISVIQTRVDPELRERTDAILHRLGLSTSDAIRMFLEQVALRRGIPFDVTLPPESPVWDEEAEGKFQSALESINRKYGNALKNLADLL
ncbi:MAG: type II toxin-antitoxin system RelB/DinJ family antitoxin [Synergistaceae bacterium]|jgi:DNA-damage-inducible protein J|nr:type II toxin-antitoxin system RelB/DinJ family antitoxin [Synergistaceae bacterium]